MAIIVTYSSSARRHTLSVLYNWLGFLCLSSLWPEYCVNSAFGLELSLPSSRLTPALELFFVQIKHESAQRSWNRAPGSAPPILHTQITDVLSWCFVAFNQQPRGERKKKKASSWKLKFKSNPRPRHFINVMNSEGRLLIARSSVDRLHWKRSKPTYIRAL